MTDELENQALSHGCVRIQDPAKFAALLVEGDPSWTAKKINAAMNQEKEQIVELKKHSPVVVFYMTFWADSNGAPLSDQIVTIVTRKCCLR